MNCKRKEKKKTWSRGTNSRLPFAVNVTPNLSIIKGKISCGSTHDVTNKSLCQGLYMKQNGEVTLSKRP